MTDSRPVVLYNPRGEGHILPLALVHVGSMLEGRRVEIVDGRLELAPEARVCELVKEASCLGVSVLTGVPIRDAVHVHEPSMDVHVDLSGTKR